MDSLGANPDDLWAIAASVGSTEMVGESTVKRHTTAVLIGRLLIIEVTARGWLFEVTLSSGWTRTPSGIGDWMQTHILDSMQNLECDIILTPQWTEG
jgi:hypothetical protein